MPEVDFLTNAIDNLEKAERTAPSSAVNEIRGVVEELVYLRLRLSMGDIK